MSKNLRGNIEANKQESAAILESKKQDSTKANTINAESSTLKSNIDANNEARLDSNNDEIVYEIWHKIG